MNWDAVGAVAELLGALGVIGSLVYLATQIRQNTGSLHSSTYQSLHDSSVNRFLALAHDRALADIVERGSADLSSLEGIERLQFDYFARAAFRGFENYHYQRQKGFLEKDLWISHERAIRGALSSPGLRKWWSRNRNFLSPSFGVYLDSLLRESIAATDSRGHEADGTKRTAE